MGTKNNNTHHSWTIVPDGIYLGTKMETIFSSQLLKKLIHLSIFFLLWKCISVWRSCVVVAISVTTYISTRIDKSSTQYLHTKVHFLMPSPCDAMTFKGTPQSDLYPICFVEKQILPLDFRYPIYNLINRIKSA